MIDDFNSSTRYRRRKKTEKTLQFIHGGATGSYYGAWDYLSANASFEWLQERQLPLGDLWQGHERVSVITRSN